jgi:hypothetical protein
MARGEAINWSRSEEQNLQSWLFQHRKLSWKARSKAYFRQYRLRRSGESLRCKQNDLRRRSRLRKTPEAAWSQPALRRTMLQRRRTAAPPTQAARQASSPEMSRLLERIRELEVSKWPSLFKSLITREKGKRIENNLVRLRS